MPERLARLRTWFFDGVPLEALEPELESVARLRVPVGEAILSQGDRPGRMYVLLSGHAVVVLDRGGQEHAINRVGPGTMVGDISFLTGQPATATVRATTPLEALALDQDDFQRLAGAFPQIYANVARILSERLARVTHRTLDVACRVSILSDTGAPPLLGYAVACSVAWHTRAPTLLLALTDGAAPEPLARLAEARPGPASLDRGALQAVAALGRSRGRRYGGETLDPANPPGAHLLLMDRSPGLAVEELLTRLDELTEVYRHVLLQVPGEPPSELQGRTLRLAAAGAAPSAAREVCTVSAWVEESGPPRPDAAGVLRIPPPNAADEQALRRGLLPVATAFGKALGWAARDLSGLKVGLALGAGTEKGYAHVGVLRALERAGLPVDYLAGTSVGAGVAAAYASGYRPDAITGLLDQMSAAMFRPALPIVSLLSNANLRFQLRRLVGSTLIENLPVPLAIVAADMLTRQEVVFRRGPLTPALLASMAVPGIYPALRIGGHTLIDGGVLDPVPSSVVSHMGADVVIGVKLARAPGAMVWDATAAEPAGRPPSILQVLTRSIELTQGKIHAETAAKREQPGAEDGSGALILIAPELEEIGAWGLRHFREGRRYVEPAEAAAEEALRTTIAAALPWIGA